MQRVLWIVILIFLQQLRTSLIGTRRRAEISQYRQQTHVHTHANQITAHIQRDTRNV